MAPIIASQTRDTNVSAEVVTSVLVMSVRMQSNANIHIQYLMFLFARSYIQLHIIAAGNFRCSASLCPEMSCIASESSHTPSHTHTHSGARSGKRVLGLGELFTRQTSHVASGSAESQPQRRGLFVIWCLTHIQHWIIESLSSRPLSPPSSVIISHVCKHETINSKLVCSRHLPAGGHRHSANVLHLDAN